MHLLLDDIIYGWSMDMGVITNQVSAEYCTALVPLFLRLKYIVPYNDHHGYNALVSTIINSYLIINIVIVEVQVIMY